MRYFKIEKKSFDSYIEITEDELLKALAIHMFGGKAIFSGGSITGDQINDIVPDYHRAMGWNAGYKLQPEDHAEVRQKCGDYRSVLTDAKDALRFIQENKRTDLLNVPFTQALEIVTTERLNLMQKQETLQID